MSREQSVDFVYPADEAEVEEPQDEKREARAQAAQIALGICDYFAKFTDPRSLMIALAAVRCTFEPEPIARIARRLGCSRKTVYKWLNRVRRTPLITLGGVAVSNRVRSRRGVTLPHE